MNAARRSVTRADIDREMIARRGFTEFVRRAWSTVDSSPLQWNWHIDAIAEHLTALHKREIRSLVVNIPPSCNKSMECSVLFPAWVWTFEPEHRWLMLTYDRELSDRDARKMRTLVQSQWYRERWPQVEIPMDRTASTAVSIYANTRGGMRISTTIGGGVTGKHAHTAGVDDPIDTKGAGMSSGKELDAVLRFYRETLPTRFVDPPTSARFCVMQRLHERDLAAEMAREGATMLCLPMRYESKHPYVSPRDPRTVDGELLFPERFPEEYVATMERTMGPSAVASQLQQRPAPAGGGIFKETWMSKFWTTLPPGGTFEQSWDFKAKDVQTGSYVCGQCWYSVGPNHYLVDQVRGRFGFNETLGAVRSFSLAWPRATKKYFEDKAAGPAIGEVLRKELPGIVMVEPDGDKAARAMSTEPLWAGGNIYLPNPGDGTTPERAPQFAAIYPDGRRGAPWVAGFIAEHASFPNGANDDQVDTASQYLNRHTKAGWGAKWGKALDAVKAEMQGRSQ